MPLPLFLGIAAAAAAGTKVVKTQVEKSKTLNEVIGEAEELCKKEALSFAPQKTPTDFQQKMFDLMRKHAFTDYEKNTIAPISADWGHLPKGLNPVASKKYSLIGWGEYSFFTTKAAYYHCKKKGLHACLYFDYINTYDSSTDTVDYGPEHQERCLSEWNSDVKAIIAKIAHIWNMQDETDTSILEFCFNSGGINFGIHTFQAALKTHCKEKQSVLRENLEHIKISSIQNGIITLRFSMYFPRVPTIEIYENDSEYERERKEREQEELIWEAEDREREAWETQQKLAELACDIAQVFQLAIYDQYGVLYGSEKIVFSNDPDFTYGRPSTIERLSSAVDNLNGAANSVRVYVDDYAEKREKFAEKHQK